MIINHNMSAINANRTLKFNEWEVQKSAEKLASGMRINRAGDDASGLAVSEKMRSQVRGLRMAERNAEDGMSFIQTAEGFLNETTELIQRIRELSIQAANGIYTEDDRRMIQVEVSQLVDEVDRIASQAEFNTNRILLGEFSEKNGTKSMWLHVGPNANQREIVYIGTMTAAALKMREGGIDMSSPDKANEMIGKMDFALQRVSKQRADLGAYQNRLELTAKGLMSAYENIQASESRIRDTDMAEAMVEYTKNIIITMASTSMLAQASFRPQSVLRLLDGM